ncbi:MAG: SRPBCC domain-containing protein [Planctomycetes bacterium]|nr:SRPBCC domain-containing protein [Planctomycetota bacterium]
MTTGNELVITRTFEAAIGLVWDAWTKPEHLARWWGPKHYSSPDPKIDLKVGGKLLLAMRGPDGKTHYTAGVFREIAPPGKLVCDTHFADASGKKIRPAEIGFPGDWHGETTIDVTLEDLGERTRMIVRQTGVLPEFNDMSRAGWGTSLEKLAEVVTADRGIVVNRTFDAPRKLVWEVFTKPEHMDKWWGPDGFTNKTQEMDFREGGAWKYTMVAADGTVFKNYTEYTEIVEPELISYKHGTGPEDIWFRGTITFTEFMGKTTVNLHNVFPDKPSRDVVVEQYGAIEGGEQHLAKAAAYIAKMS